MLTLHALLWRLETLKLEISRMWGVGLETISKSRKNKKYCFDLCTKKIWREVKPKPLLSSMCFAYTVSKNHVSAKLIEHEEKLKA